MLKLLGWVLANNVGHEINEPVSSRSGDRFFGGIELCRNRRTLDRFSLFRIRIESFGGVKNFSETDDALLRLRPEVHLPVQVAQLLLSGLEKAQLELEGGRTAQRQHSCFSPSSPRFDSRHSRKFFSGICWCRWDLLTSQLRVKWTEVWKCQSNPSSNGEWHASTTKKRKGSK